MISLLEVDLGRLDQLAMQVTRVNRVPGMELQGFSLMMDGQVNLLPRLGEILSLSQERGIGGKHTGQLVVVGACLRILRKQLFQAGDRSTIRLLCVGELATIGKGGAKVLQTTSQLF